MRTSLWLSLFAAVALLAACSPGSGSTPSCATICSSQSACDGGSGSDAATMSADGSCLARCNSLQSVIDPTYWSGVGMCAASCGDQGTCLAAQSSRVPASTVRDFLTQVCQWAITCQPGATVEQCVSSLYRVGEGGDTSPWATLGLLRPETRQCLLGCLQRSGCGDFGASTQACMASCGLADVIGFDDEDPPMCEISCNSDCSGHGQCRVDTRMCSTHCDCEPGYVQSYNGMLTCIPDCRTNGGCGTGGTCESNGTCSCAEGYELGPDATCRRVVGFVSASVAPSAAVAVRDDGRVELFGSGVTPAPELIALSDVTWACFSRTNRDFVCVQRRDGTGVCYDVRNSSGDRLIQTAAGAPRVACGDGYYCAVTPEGTTTCAAFQRTPFPSMPPMVPASLPPLVQLSAYRHVCGRTAAGAVHCFGPDTLPQLTTPPATLGAGVQHVHVDDRRSCAIDARGSLVCWGVSEDRFPADLGAIDRIASQGNTMCARRASDHTLVCWTTEYGEVEAPEDFGRPIMELVGTRISDVSVDGIHGAFCAVLESGGMICWGSTVGVPVQRARVIRPTVM